MATVDSMSAGSLHSTEFGCKYHQNFIIIEYIYVFGVAYCHAPQSIVWKRSLSAWPASYFEDASRSGQKIFLEVVYIRATRPAGLWTAVSRSPGKDRLCMDVF